MGSGVAISLQAIIFGVVVLLGWLLFPGRHLGPYIS